jgi:hypothetical protein
MQTSKQANNNNSSIGALQAEKCAKERTERQGCVGVGTRGCDPTGSHIVNIRKKVEINNNPIHM